MSKCKPITTLVAKNKQIRPALIKLWATNVDNNKQQATKKKTE